jgi:hypothetical protein
MLMTSINQGELVYARAYSTKRSAVAELLTALPNSDGDDWRRVRLVTDWYDWDEVAGGDSHPLRAGEVLQLEAFRLEAIRR